MSIFQKKMHYVTLEWLLMGTGMFWSWGEVDDMLSLDVNLKLNQPFMQCTILSPCLTSSF